MLWNLLTLSKNQPNKTKDLLIGKGLVFIIEISDRNHYVDFVYGIQLIILIKV